MAAGASPVIWPQGSVSLAVAAGFGPQAHVDVVRRLLFCETSMLMTLNDGGLSMLRGAGRACTLPESPALIVVRVELVPWVTSFFFYPVASTSILFSFPTRRSSDLLAVSVYS